MCGTKSFCVRNSRNDGESILRPRYYPGPQIMEEDSSVPKRVQTKTELIFQTEYTKYYRLYAVYYIPNATYSIPYLEAPGYHD